jgi:hypothetical protein
VIRTALLKLGIPSSAIFLQGHLESFYAYLMNQKKELLTYHVALLEYERDCITAWHFYYVAAEETMNKGILARIFKLAGAVTVKRTWRAEGKNVNRMVDLKEVENILKALDNGWVISFPQGTTSAFAILIL